MLCESKSRIGFLGACFFIGAIIASSIIPVGYISDVYGRKWVFIGSMISEILSCYLMLIATSLDQLYIAMVLMGCGHPGRFIVAVNYADEFLSKRQKEFLLPLNQLVQGTTIIFTAFYYQVLSRNVVYIQWGNLIFIISMTFYTAIYLPESPKYLYAKGMFDELRDCLEVVARTNGIKTFKKEKIVFVSEQGQPNEEEQEEE